MRSGESFHRCSPSFAAKEAKIIGLGPIPEGISSENQINLV
jgi:hypothetical protein